MNKVIHGNIMEVPHDQILPSEVPSPEQVSHIMGNLPFNVASPLLVRWLHASAAREGLFGLGPVWLTLMFQKEVGLVSFLFLGIHGISLYAVLNGSNDIE